MTVHVMHRGDTFSFSLTLTDQAGEPLDTTGLPITFTAKRTFSGPVFLVKTQDDGIDPDGASGDTGMVTVTIEPEDTEDLIEQERFWWDIETDDLGVVRTQASGRLVVLMDVSAVQGSGS
jgi:hypothetical protein